MRNVFCVIVTLFICAPEIKAQDAGTLVEYTSKYDEFEETTTSCMHNNVILSDDENETSITFGLFITKNNMGFYVIVVNAGVISKNGFSIGDGESLQLIVDGKVMKFKIGEAHHENGPLLDFAFYDITSNQVRKIAYAKSVKVRLVGKRRYATGHFAPRNVENVKEFYKKFLLPLSSK